MGGIFSFGTSNPIRDLELSIVCGNTYALREYINTYKSSLPSFINDKLTLMEWTLLHRACYISGETLADQKADMVTLLVENGADINAMGKDGRTPLSICCEFGKEQAAEYLLEKCNAPASVIYETEDEKDKWKTPIDYACESGNVNIVKLLMKHDKNFISNLRRVAVNATDKFTPFQRAVSKNHVEVVKLLLELDPTLLDDEVSKKMMIKNNNNKDVAPVNEDEDEIAPLGSIVENLPERNSPEIRPYGAALQNSRQIREYLQKEKDKKEAAEKKQKENKNWFW